MVKNQKQINEIFEKNNVAPVDENTRVADISENIIRETMPEILDILLVDRTTSTSLKNKNIIWGNDNYTIYGAKQYAITAQIKPELITGVMGNLIMPRALKSKTLQKQRTDQKQKFLRLLG